MEIGALTREELIAIITAQQAQLEALAARVAALEEENRRLRGGKTGGTPVAVKPSRPSKEKKKRKRREQSFTRRRETPNEVRYHAVECCPKCGRRLCGGWEHRRRQSIEVSVQVKVIDHVLVARRCGACQKRWLPQLRGDVFGTQGKRRLGVSVQALVTMLHIGCRVPMKMIRRILRELCGLHISNGEVVALLDGVRVAGEASLQQLLEAVRGSPAVCADETGWRQEGENGYLWTFATPTVRYFVYRQSRAGQVPKEVLGEDFSGVVACDFYGGYNKLGQLQRCWFHLLKDAKELAEINADRPETVAWVEALGTLYEEAKACSLALGALPAQHRVRHKERRRFERLATKLAQLWAKDPDAPQRVLAHRIMKHRHELFVFLSDPAVPATNNLAERSLRPAVVARKISGGTRSAKGSGTKMALMSHFGTWLVQDKPLLESCRQLLLSPAPA